MLKTIVNTLLLLLILIIYLDLFKKRQNINKLINWWKVKLPQKIQENQGFHLLND